MQIQKGITKIIYPLKLPIEIHKIWAKELNKLLGIRLTEIQKIKFNRYKDNKMIYKK